MSYFIAVQPTSITYSISNEGLAEFENSDQITDHLVFKLKQKGFRKVRSRAQGESMFLSEIVATAPVCKIVRHAPDFETSFHAAMKSVTDALEIASVGSDMAVLQVACVCERNLTDNLFLDYYYLSARLAKKKQ